MAASSAWYNTKFMSQLRGPMRLFLVRHGQSEANICPATISGRSSHVNLTDLGEKQAHALGEYFKSEDVAFDLSYSSTAVRTQQTAMKALGHENFTVSDELLEIDMGEWVGNDRFEKYTPEVYSLINADPWNFKPDGGESQKDVEERICRYFQDVIIREVEEMRERENKENVSVCIFGHCLATACFLRGILCSDPAMTWKIKNDNTAITELKYTPKDGWFLVRINHTPHFGLLQSE